MTEAQRQLIKIIIKMLTGVINKLKELLDHN